MIGSRATAQGLRPSPVVRALRPRAGVTSDASVPWVVRSLATRAASGIPEFDELMDKAQSKAPTRSLVSIDDVGAATAFLALDGAKLITGNVMYIDGGYHIMD